MAKQKKESVKNPLKWISFSGFIFAGLILIFNLIVYFSSFVEAVKNLDWLFFVQFIFSNNLLFFVLFVLISLYIIESNKLARVLWIVLSAYFVIPSIPSLISSFYPLDGYAFVGLAINLYLVITSLCLLFNKKIKEKFE